MDRREFLFKGTMFVATAATSSILLPQDAIAQDDSAFWNLPRSLRLLRSQTGEFIDEVYWLNGRLHVPGYIKICQILRDVSAQKVVQMDVRLLDLMRAIQAYVDYYGYKEPLRINSGYRTWGTNSKLEGAAKNSEHLKGRAIDFSMPGLPTNYMGLLASHYKAGGVGFYPNSGFVHLDTANVRYWVQKGKSGGVKKVLKNVPVKPK